MAGPIPREFIDDLLDRADIAQIVGERVKLKRAGREYKGLCPFHQEKTPSFTVSPSKGFFHCFGCNAHGSALSFLMLHDRLDFPAAVEALADRYGLEVPRTGPSRPSGKGLYDLLQAAGRHYFEQLKGNTQAQDYLKGRGLTGEIASSFGLGYAPRGNSALARFGQSDEDRRRLVDADLAIRNDSGEVYDRFRDRIMFPIRDRRGRVTGFGGRAMGDAQPKYMNSPETPVFHKGRELYGLYELGRRKVGRCVLVEGYMDVIGLAQHDVAGAMATLGTAVTPRQLTRLFGIAPSVVFCFDGDAAGRRAAERAMERALPEMRDGRQLSFAFLPEGEDPDSYVRSEGAASFNAGVGGRHADVGVHHGKPRAKLRYQDRRGARAHGGAGASAARFGPGGRIPRPAPGPAGGGSATRRGAPAPTARGPARPPCAAPAGPIERPLRRGPWDALAENADRFAAAFPRTGCKPRSAARLRAPKGTALSPSSRSCSGTRAQLNGANPAKLLERYRERPEYALLSRAAGERQRS